MRLYSADNRVKCMYNYEVVMGAHVYVVINGVYIEACA